MSLEFEARLKAAADAAMDGVRLDHPAEVETADDAATASVVSIDHSPRRQRRMLTATLIAAALALIVGIVAVVGREGDERPTLDLAGSALEGDPRELARLAIDVLWREPWKAELTQLRGSAARGELQPGQQPDAYINTVVVRPPERALLSDPSDEAGQNDELSVGDITYRRDPDGSGWYEWDSTGRVDFINGLSSAFDTMLAPGNACWSVEGRTVIGTLDCPDGERPSPFPEDVGFAPSMLRVTIDADGRPSFIETDNTLPDDTTSLRFDISYDDVPDLPDPHEVTPAGAKEAARYAIAFLWNSPWRATMTVETTGVEDGETGVKELSVRNAQHALVTPVSGNVFVARQLQFGSTVFIDVGDGVWNPASEGELPDVRMLSTLVPDATANDELCWTAETDTKLVGAISCAGDEGSHSPIEDRLSDVVIETDPESGKPVVIEVVIPGPGGHRTHMRYVFGDYESVPEVPVPNG